MRLTVAVAIEVLLVLLVEWVFCCSAAVSGLSRLLKPSCEVEDDM
jgi:hypothetical protein